MSRALPLPELARGEGWIVVSKAPRLLVHRNAKMRHEQAALQRVRDQVGTRVNPVHRLDRQASGCLLFATDLDLTGALHDALRDPRAEKTYVCLSRGVLQAEGPVVVESALKVSDTEDKEARSVVEVLGTVAEPRCSVLRVRPETGRFHQVRRHVRDLHHPIIADAEHGDSRVNGPWRDQRGTFRLQLHCLRLRLPLADGSWIEAESPLWADMHAVWSALPCWPEVLAAEPALGAPPLEMLADVPVIPREWEWAADDPRRRGFS